MLKRHTHVPQRDKKHTQSSTRDGTLWLDSGAEKWHRIGTLYRQSGGRKGLERGKKALKRPGHMGEAVRDPLGRMPTGTLGEHNRQKVERSSNAQGLRPHTDPKRAQKQGNSRDSSGQGKGHMRLILHTGHTTGPLHTNHHRNIHNHHRNIHNHTTIRLKQRL